MKKTTHTIHDVRVLLKQVQKDIDVINKNVSKTAKHVNKVILGKKERPAYVNNDPVYMYAGTTYNVW